MLRAKFEVISDRHGGRRLVILCFEDVLAGHFCHRRVWAGWWHERTGQSVPELEPGGGRDPAISDKPQFGRVGAAQLDLEMGL